MTGPLCTPTRRLLPCRVLRCRMLPCLVLAAGLQFAPAARPEPGYYVVTPYVNEGLVIADFRYWTVQPRGHGEIQWPEIGLGRGIGSRWTTEFYASWIRSSKQATRIDSFNWQNDVLLTQGEWPVDLALHTQWVGERQDERQRTFEFGPAMQTEVGRTQLNFNLFFERPLGPATQPTLMQYQWQLRHHWEPGLHVGAQGFGELGTWNHWAASGQQSHRAGPALFGTWHLSEEQTLKLQAAWLMGSTGARQGHMFTLRAHAEY